MPVVSSYLTVRGEDWSQLSDPGVGGVADMAVSAGGVWIGLRETDANSVRRSTDAGSTWANTSIPGSSGTKVFTGVAFGGGVFAIVQSETGIWTSPDGITWTQRVTSSFFPAGIQSGNMVYNDGYFILSLGNLTNTSYIAASPDGVSWTLAPQGSITGTFTARALYVSSLNRTFAGSGTSYRFVNAVPTSATAWSSAGITLSGNLLALAWSPTLSVAVAVTSTSIRSSPDLLTWTSRVSTTAYTQVSWCGDQFVAVGTIGRIVTSFDGITWTAQASNVTDSLVSVASNSESILVGGGVTGALLRSP